MDSQYIEDLIREALEAKQAKFEISEPRRVLILSVPNDAELVGSLDRAINLRMGSLAPLDRRGKVEPTPLFRICHYTVSSMLREKRTANGRCFYDFTYTPK